MGLFRKGPSPHQAAIAMIGAKPGDRVLVAGRPEPAVVAALAGITGLLGETLVAADAASGPSFQKAAADEGVLIEIADMPGTRLPAPDGMHDVVAIHLDLAGLTQPDRDLLMADAVAATRPGGRIVIIEGRRRTSVFATRTATLPPETILEMLTRAGLVAARTLGTLDTVTYFEGRKARIPHTPPA
jgi:hypothetical protein